MCPHTLGTEHRSGSDAWRLGYRFDHYLPVRHALQRDGTRPGMEREHSRVMVVGGPAVSYPALDVEFLSVFRIDDPAFLATLLGPYLYLPIHTPWNSVNRSVRRPRSIYWAGCRPASTVIFQSRWSKELDNSYGKVISQVAEETAV